MEINRTDLFPRTDKEIRGGGRAEIGDRSISHTTGIEIIPVGKLRKGRSTEKMVKAGEKIRPRKEENGIENVIRGNRRKSTAKRKLDFGGIGMESTVECKTTVMK